MNLEKIRESVDNERKFAQRIMEGEVDNYDGADGARTVLELCDFIDSLLAEIAKGGV